MNKRDIRHSKRAWRNKSPQELPQPHSKRFKRLQAKRQYRWWLYHERLRVLFARQTYFFKNFNIGYSLMGVAKKYVVDRCMRD